MVLEFFSLGEDEFTPNFGEGGGNGGDSGVELGRIGVGKLAEFRVEVGEGFYFAPKHFYFGGVLFVVGANEGVDALALGLEFLGEEVGAVVGVLAFVIEEPGEALFVGGARFFESGAVDFFGGFAVKLEGAVGGLALFGILILHPLEGLTHGHGRDGGVGFLSRKKSGKKCATKEGRESHKCLTRLGFRVTFSMVEFSSLDPGGASFFRGAMQRIQLKSKLHRAIIKQADIDYEGSIEIPEDLMEAAGLWEGERVLVTSMTAGGRLETYAQTGPSGTGNIIINGGAAHLIKKGECVTIMAFGISDAHIIPRRHVLNDENEIIKSSGV